MIKFLLLILLAMPVQAQEQTVVQHDPNEPLPEAPIKIDLPHSNRTRDNMGEALVDFLLTKGFQSIPWADISYDFFEIKEEMTLKFTNFKIVFKQSEISQITDGTMTFGTFEIDFKQLLTYLKTKEPTIGRMFIEKFSTKNLKWKNHSQPYNFSASQIQITNLRSVNTSTSDKFFESSIFKLAIEQADVTEGRAIVNNQKYRAKSLVLKNFTIEQDRKPSLVEAEGIILDSTPLKSFDELQQKTRFGGK